MLINRRACAKAGHALLERLADQENEIILTGVEGGYFLPSSEGLIYGGIDVLGGTGFWLESIPELASNNHDLNSNTLRRGRFLDFAEEVIGFACRSCPLSEFQDSYVFVDDKVPTFSEEEQVARRALDSLNAERTDNESDDISEALPVGAANQCN